MKDQQKSSENIRWHQFMFWIFEFKMRWFWPQNLEVNISFNVEEKKDGRAMQTSPHPIMFKRLQLYSCRDIHNSIFPALKISLIARFAYISLIYSSKYAISLKMMKWQIAQNCLEQTKWPQANPFSSLLWRTAVFLTLYFNFLIMQLHIFYASINLCS